MDIAWRWSEESTCSHLNVGAVLAQHERTIASGFNGAPPGLPHCNHDDSAGYIPCDNTNHAEGNAIAFAARYPISTAGATLYTTHSPCKVCAGLIISAGIVRVVYGDVYLTDGRGAAGILWLEAAGLLVDAYTERMKG